MVNVIEILKSELAKSEYTALVQSQDYPAIASLLNKKPLIPNPVGQITVDKLPTILELFAAITPAEAIEIYKIPGLVADIRVAADSKNKASLQAYLVIVSGLLSQQSKDAVQILLNQTQLDPNYQSQIPGQSKAEQLGVYPVSPSQVQEALN
ncbi:hypothetical protein FD723_18795 [Nostoc sp. C052]|uniref:hypothetical protein n=1 Tax=Nostoc sp. C052 TaxID=2576902 RepID=UPI0015C2E50F|nr:hypothetical protein [Nostoc sp. C052]QLE42269.1 hypothetical protein FD723_18795 [Nostoc sp. C052]